MILSLGISEVLNIIKPLVIFIAAMGIYSVFIFKFYRFLARKDIIEIDLEKHNNANHWFIKKVFSGILYLIQYVILVPIFIFFWFAFLALLLVFLAKNQTIDQVLLVSMATVGTIRILSYYSEDLSKDLAKMLPFALLGVFIIDATFLNIENIFLSLNEIPDRLYTLIYYFVFIVLLEFLMRFLYLISNLFFPKEKTNKKKD